MKQILLLLAFCFAGSLGYAQSNLSILDVIPVLTLEQFTGVDPMTSNGTTTTTIAADINTQQFNLTAHIELSDVSNVQTIHIRIGHVVDSADFAELTIPYAYSSLPSGIVGIQKSGQTFSIDFGLHTNIYTLHFEVWAEDMNGVSSPVFNKRLN